MVIATPDHWHLKMTQEALAAGKHVYIEKPMTHSWEEGEAFIKAVEKSGKVLQVGSQYMSMGCAQKAADFIRSGRLGQVTLVEGRFHRNTATGAWYSRSRPTPRRRRSTSRGSSAPRRRTTSTCGASSSGASSGTTRAGCPPTSSCTW